MLKNGSRSLFVQGLLILLMVNGSNSFAAQSRIRRGALDSTCETELLPDIDRGPLVRQFNSEAIADILSRRMAKEHANVVLLNTESPVDVAQAVNRLRETNPEYSVIPVLATGIMKPEDLVYAIADGLLSSPTASLALKNHFTTLAIEASPVNFLRELIQNVIAQSPPKAIFVVEGLVQFYRNNPDLALAFIQRFIGTPAQFIAPNLNREDLDLLQRAINRKVGEANTKLVSAIISLAEKDDDDFKLPTTPELIDTGYFMTYEPEFLSGIKELLASKPNLRLYQKLLHVLSRLSDGGESLRSLDSKLVKSMPGSVFRTVIPSGAGGYRLLWRYSTTKRTIVVIRFAIHDEAYPDKG